MTGFDPAVLVAAFMAGLLGSGHCFAMCGGIAGSLGVLATEAPGGRLGAARRALEFHLGRWAGYALLGAAGGGLLGLLGGGVGRIPQWSVVLRLLTALLILAMGLHYAFGWGGLRHLERLGARVWARIRPLVQRLARHPDRASGRLVLGLCWGLLPCGLVYTALLTAASTGSGLSGGLTMLAFGLGTAPAMLGLTLTAPGFAALLSDRGFRRFVGLSLVLLAVWMGYVALAALSGGAHHHH